MEPNKKITTSRLHPKLIYLLFSGILFLVLGIVIFLRAEGYRNFLSAGIFGLLLGAYGIYRIIMFMKLSKKARE